MLRMVKELREKMECPANKTKEDMKAEMRKMQKTIAIEKLGM